MATDIYAKAMEKALEYLDSLGATMHRRDVRLVPGLVQARYPGGWAMFFFDATGIPLRISS